MNHAHLCRFDTTLDLRKPTYETVKARVLEAGRYSCFDVCANAKLAAIFIRLEHDPDLVCTTVGFPWVKVERKDSMQQVCGHVPADPTKDQTVCEKAAWEVCAGLISGQPMPEYTKRFVYTSEDYEEDGRHAKELEYHPIFMKRMAEASSYHQQMSNPQTLNWAELTFIWY